MTEGSFNDTLHEPLEDSIRILKDTQARVGGEVW